MRVVLLSLMLLVAIGVGGYGFVARGAAAVCDTSCPSDAELATFKVMFWAGLVATVLACISLIAIARRARNR